MILRNNKVALNSVLGNLRKYTKQQIKTFLLFWVSFGFFEGSNAFALKFWNYLAFMKSHPSWACH